MGIDLTGREEQEWLQREAPPLKHSELVSDEEALVGAKEELVPHFASRLEERLTPDVRDIFVYLRTPDYYLIATVALDSAPDRTIDEVMAEAQEAAVEEDVSVEEYSQVYIAEVIDALFQRVDDMRLRLLAKFISRERKEKMESDGDSEDELPPDDDEPPENTDRDQPGLSWVKRELPKYKRKIIA